MRLRRDGGGVGGLAPSVRVAERRVVCGHTSRDSQMKQRRDRDRRGRGAAGAAVEPEGAQGYGHDEPNFVIIGSLSGTFIVQQTYIADGEERNII
jgi:hypothetical protein